jgi:hypothetical protein
LLEPPADLGARGNPNVREASLMEDIGDAANLEAPGPPRGDRDDVVDDEGHLLMIEDVPELQAPGEVPSAEVDVMSVELEGHRDDVRLSVYGDRGNPAEAPAAQVVCLLVGECLGPRLRPQMNHSGIATNGPANISGSCWLPSRYRPDYQVKAS